MDAVGFSQQSQQNMFAVISAVLLLGNIQYVRVRKECGNFPNKGLECFSGHSEFLF